MGMLGLGRSPGFPPLVVVDKSRMQMRHQVEIPSSLSDQAGIIVPAVSVLIPTFNATSFIQDALESVATQTFQDYEIVVVDDGSTDSTVKRVAGWSSSHSIVSLRLVQQTHAGISAARNVGVQEARAGYVAFLDADDLWEENKLQVVMECLRQSSNPDLVCHDEWIEERGRRRGVCRHGPYGNYCDLLFKGNCVSTSAVVVRRSLVLQVGGFSWDLTCGMEDYDLWLRLAAAGCRFEYLHDVLGGYRRLGQGITSKVQPHFEEGLEVLAAHYREWQKKTPYYGYLLRRRRAAMLRGACRSFMERGEHKEAGRFWRRSLAEDPLSWKTWALGVLNLARIRL